MTGVNFWTTHIVSGGSDNLAIPDDITEVIVTAVAGDCYVVHDSSAHPPALDTMSTSNHWAGAVVMEGDTRRFAVQDASVEYPNTTGNLYFGPVTPSSGACTISVILTRRAI